jgi:hypothetical protein
MWRCLFVYEAYPNLEFKFDWYSLLEICNRNATTSLLLLPDAPIPQSVQAIRQTPP